MNSIFDKEGMMIFPNPAQHIIREQDKVLVINECYCPNGHNLVNRKAMFGEFPGILLRVKQNNEEGFVALSPVYGDKSKISLDIELADKQILEISCPECGEKLAVYTRCDCGADLVSLFLTKSKSFSEVVAVCTRVNCFNAQIKSSNEIMSLMMNT